jgi:hypothetical protein
MFATYKKVWSVHPSYKVEVGKHSSEEAAEADLQKVLGSPNWADAQSVESKALKIAQEYVDRYNSGDFMEVLTGQVSELIHKGIESDISGHTVYPTRLVVWERFVGPINLKGLQGVEDLEPIFRESHQAPVVVKDCWLREPKIEYRWETTRWGSFRQKVSGYLRRLGNRIDPDYTDDDDYWDDED